MNDWEVLSDEGAIRRVLEGHRDAFGVLVHRYSGALYGLAYAHLGNRADAEEIAQESFLKALQSLHTLRNFSKFPSWLHAIARNLCVSRKRRSWREVPLEPAHVDIPASGEPNDRAEETAALLWNHIEKLPEKQREILLLYYFSGRSTEQIGLIYRIRPRAAAKRLERARRMLGERIVTQLSNAVETLRPKAESERRTLALVVGAPVPWTAGSSSAAATAAGLAMSWSARWAAAALVAALGISAALVVIRSYRQVAPLTPGTATSTSLLTVATPNSGAISGVNPSVSPFPSQRDGIRNGNAQSPESMSMVMAQVEVNAGGAEPTITGKVVDESGRPITGARVRARGTQSSHEFSTTSNDQGKFTLTCGSVDPELYIIAESEGVSSQETGPLRVGQHGLQVVSLKAYRTSSISGRCVDEKGRPIKHGSVTATPEHRHGLINLTTISDADGAFTLARVPPGKYGVGVLVTTPADVKDRFVSGEFVPKLYFYQPELQTQVEVVPAQQLTNVSVTLSESEEISGRVVDLDGKPIAEGMVVARSTSSSVTLRDSILEGGAFHLRRVKPGQYTIRAQTHSGESEPQEISAGAKDLVLTLLRGGVLDGIVARSDTNTPVENFTIRLGGGALAPKPSANLIETTHPDGRFHFENVPAGMLSIAVNAPGMVPYEEWTKLSPGQTIEDMAIRLDPAGAVDGIVTAPDDSPVSGAYVIDEKQLGLFSPTQPSASRSRTDRKGHFYVDTLPLRAVTLWAWSPDYAAAGVIVTPETNATQSVTIRLTTGGTVECFATMNGVPARNVSIRGGTRAGIRGEAQGITGADGRYLYPHLTPGTALLKAEIRADANTIGSQLFIRSIEREVTILEAETTRVVFPFGGEGASLEGTVAIAGEPPSHYTLKLVVSLPGGEEEHVDISRGTDGDYHFDRLPAGHARVSLWGGSQTVRELRREFTCDLRDNEVTHLDMAITGPGVISGQVIGLTSEANCTIVPESVDIGADQESVRIALQQRIAAVTVKPDGSFEVSGLDPGTYKVVVSSRAPRTSKGPVKCTVQRVVVDGSRPTVLEVDVTR